MPPSERPTLSVVIPVFNEEAMIPELDRRLGAFLADLPEVGGSWEVVFIDDGSADRSLEMLKAMAAREPRYKIISFARNFGHQIAITAGIDRAAGDAVVVMDADLQDPPEVVRAMIASGARATTSSTACAPSARARPGSSAARRRPSTGCSRR